MTTSKKTSRKKQRDPLLALAAHVGIPSSRKLAKVSGLARTQIDFARHGKIRLKRGSLEKLGAALGMPPETVEALILRGSS